MLLIQLSLSYKTKNNITLNLSYIGIWAKYKMYYNFNDFGFIR